MRLELVKFTDFIIIIDQMELENIERDLRRA
jgi:hypothetical protein